MTTIPDILLRGAEAVRVAQPIVSLCQHEHWTYDTLRAVATCLDCGERLR